MRSSSEQALPLGTASDTASGESPLGSVDSSILETAIMYANEGRCDTSKEYLSSLSLEGQQRVLDLLLDLSRFLNRSIQASEQATVSLETEGSSQEQYTREL